MPTKELKKTLFFVCFFVCMTPVVDGFNLKNMCKSTWIMKPQITGEAFQSKVFETIMGPIGSIGLVGLLDGSHELGFNNQHNSSSCFCLDSVSHTSTPQSRFFRKRKNFECLKTSKLSPRKTKSFYYFPPTCSRTSPLFRVTGLV